MKNIIYLSIIGFLLIFIIKLECGKPVEKKEVVKIEGKKYEVVKRDTVYQQKTITKYKDGAYIYKYDSVYIKVPIDIDTSSIIKDYYSLNMFSDTFKTDIGSIIIKDTISENKIKGRNYTSIFKYPEYVTYLKDKPKNQVFIGTKATIQNKSINEIGAGLMLKTKRDRMYGVGALVDRQKNVNFTIDFYIKL